MNQCPFTADARFIIMSHFIFYVRCGTSFHGVLIACSDILQVTETADFQKDLCLDSLDRVELVMAFEQEFSIEIPDEKADKINSCADAIRYIASQPKYNTQGSS